MANLTAVFELIDRMSDRLDRIANSGTDAVEQWERAGEAADSAFGTAESGGQRAATACDGVASSARSMGDAMEDSSDTAREQEQMFALCEQSAAALNDAIEASTSIQEELEAAMENAGEASKDAEEALRALESAQNEAADAMANYDAVLTSGTDDLGELESAAERAMHAAENLATANERASQATAELGQQSEETGDEFEDTGQKGIEAFEAIGNTLIGAAIAKQLKEAAEAAYELVDAFSEAESTVVIATGATGAALDGLTASMNKAYAASRTGDLQQTAAAVGEINTRLGYTGEALEETTGLFLDFAAVTGGQASSSVRSVTQLMNQWNVGANQMESTLDKLTYAGQASGISVDSLTSQLTANKSILDQLGFSLDESIAMFSQFELNGTQAASVMTGFRSALSSGAISSLEDLYDVFDRISSGELDAAGAAEIFGARAGTTIVNAVNNGTFALDDMVDALENTRGTTVATAEAAQTLGQQWEQASNNINSAFTSAIEPVTSRISSGLASVANSVGNFLNQHPTVTKAITAVGVGLGVVAVGVAGVSIASLKAIPAVAAFGTALQAALGPIGWIALGITAVTAAVLLLDNALNGAEDATLSMTATTLENYNAMQEVTAAYEEAVEKYGETSEEASRLRYEMQELTAAYESSAQTVEEFCAQCDDVIDRHQQMVEELDKNADALKTNELDNLALIAKLEQLASQTDQTAASEQQMQAIIDALNGSIEGLNLSMGDLKGNQDGVIASVKAYAQAQADARRQEAMVEEYITLIERQAEEQEQLAAATDEVAAAESRAAEASQAYTDYLIRLTKYDTTGFAAISALWSGQAKAATAAADNLEAIRSEQEGLQDTFDDTNARIAEIEASWDAAALAAQEAAETPVAYEEAVSTVIRSVQDDIDELCAAYDAAFESARNSIDGQIGLFDTMKTETEMSVQDMQDAFTSQIEYLTLYTENLRKAAEYGIDDGLIAALSDGSEESAGYINAIIENIESLGAESGEAQAFVSDFNSAFQDVEKAKDKFATTVATMETDFDSKMAEIESRLEETIDSMNMEADAAEAARETMEAYTQAIIEGTSAAVSAAQSAASAVAAALNTSGPTGTITTVAGHAEGTTSGEDVYVAGENGPELIVGKRGSTVFPAEETMRIINAVDDFSNRQEAPNMINGVVPAQTSAIYSDITNEGNVLNRYESITELGDNFEYDNSVGDTITEGNTVMESVANSGDTFYNYALPSAEPDDNEVICVLPEHTDDRKDISDLSKGSDTKKIVLSLEGVGSIELSGNGGADKEQLLDFLQENMRPVLAGILTEEIFEEGDGSYEY